MWARWFTSQAKRKTRLCIHPRTATLTFSFPLKCITGEDFLLPLSLILLTLHCSSCRIVVSRLRETPRVLFMLLHVYCYAPGEVIHRLLLLGSAFLLERIAKVVFSVSLKSVRMFPVKCKTSVCRLAPCVFVIARMYIHLTSSSLYTCYGVQPFCRYHAFNLFALLLPGIPWLL